MGWGSSEMWRRIGLVRVEVSEECITSIFRVERHSFETLDLTRPTRRHITEDGTLHSHRRGNFKAYVKYRHVLGSK
jgi:hypothetical protein